MRKIIDVNIINVKVIDAQKASYVKVIDVNV